MDEWIKCSDRLPPEDVIVLCSDTDYIFIGYYSLMNAKTCWFDDETRYLSDITHWMSLPNLPLNDCD